MEFRLLGGVEARHEGGPVDLGPARQRCVLAALVVEPNTAVPVDRLVDRVWGDRPPQRVRGALHSHLTRLRKVLPDVRITHGPNGYVLSVDPDAVDLHRFRALVRRAVAEDDEHLYEQAAALWRGDAFEGLDTPWLTAVRAQLDRERIAAELDHTDLVLRRGGHSALIAPLTIRAARQPLDERLAAQLATALYRSGRRADALEHLRLIRLRLADDLGVSPGPRLVDLHRRVLADDPRLAEPVPRRLPAAPRSFTGRVDDLAALDQPAPLLVITGTGGIGKTWLALHWAHTRSFPDGQLFADLRGFDPTGDPLDPDTVLRGFLDALGVTSAALPPDADSRAGLYRSLLADRRMLILLDNARDAAQVVPLLPGTSACTVVVTSRDRLLGLVIAHAARPVHLDVLSDVDSCAVLIDRLGADRLSGEPVADLLAWCGGLPLALALVAGQALAHPGFPLERADHGDLSTVLSWSYRALPPEQATVFRLLGGAPGPDIGVAAAEALTGQPEQVLRALERLSLLTEHSPGRYRMHDLVRRYAVDLPDPDRPAALARLLDHQTRTATAARAALDPEIPPIPLEANGSFTDDTAALRWFDAEHRCLLAALDTTSDDLAAWHLAWALQPYHFRRAHHGQQVDTWRRGLDAARSLADPRAIAVAHQLYGHACSTVGRLDESLEHLTTALDLAPDQRFEGHVRLALAGTWHRRGDNARAVTQAADALRLFRAAGDRLWESVALISTGWGLELIGDRAGAVEHCTAALALARSHGNRHGEAAALDALGRLAHLGGEHAEAIDHYRAALALHEELDAPHDVAETLDRLGHPYAALGRTGQAHDAWRRAAALFRSQHRAADADRVTRLLPPGS